MTNGNSNRGVIVILIAALLAMLAATLLVKQGKTPEPAPSEVPIPVISILKP